MKLFTDTNSLKPFLAVSHDFNFDRVASNLSRAASVYIVPFIGQTMADRLVTYYNNGSPVADADMKPVLELAQQALANYAFALYVPEGSVRIDSSGIHETQSPQQKTASWGNKKDLVTSLVGKGDDAMDLLIDLLESKPDTYTQWRDSEQRTELHSLFVRSVSEFEQSQHIQGSYRTFLSLRHIMRDVEEIYLEPSIGADFCEELRSKATPVSEEKEALRLIRKVVVNFTVARACRTHLFTLQSDGLRARSVMTVTAFIDKQTTAEREHLNMMEQEKDHMANAYLRKLRDYLDTKASDSVFKAYKDSSYYTAPADAEAPSATFNTKGFLGI